MESLNHESLFYTRQILQRSLAPVAEILRDPTSDSCNNLQSAVDLLVALKEDFVPSSKLKKHEKIGSSLLYSMMDYAPSFEARGRVANDIRACSREGDSKEMVLQRLLTLTSDYMYAIVVQFKSLKDRSPLTFHPSHTDAIEYRDESSASELTNGGRIAAKAAAFKRDNGRCLLTGILDMNLEDMAIDDESVLPIQCAHIIPYSLAAHSAIFWEIAGWFTDLKHTDLDGEKINRVDNLITLTQAIHTAFDALDLWLEAVLDEENWYRVEVLSHRLRRGLGLALIDKVHFISPDPVKLPVPNPLYLRLHAACAKIARMSGAGEVIDVLEREIDETPVLAKDGSSVHLLDHKLAVHKRSFVPASA
ncbi:hypothetical protein FRC17_000653 [Serendipita sp. 399]|nr:hypothetical protein FRC17_000653 [Serendipita sp. 399]